MTTSQNASEKLQRALVETRAMQEKLAASCLSKLSSIAELSAACLQSGGRLFFCGNGGSAAESQHLATEFVVRLSAHNDRQALAAIALTTDTSLLTACSNDFGFERVFARQLEALMRKNDVLFLLSTSGKSPNLIEAAITSHTLGGKNVGACLMHVISESLAESTMKQMRCRVIVLRRDAVSGGD